MRHLSLVVFLALGFAVGAVAQSRTTTLDGAGFVTSELVCSRNADGSWDCLACGQLPVSLDDGAGVTVSTERICSTRPRTLKTANSNRLQTVADAMSAGVLRQNGFATVDAGSP